MISAGTIAAYLTLETSKFNRGIGDAMQMLMNLAGSSSLGKLALEQLNDSAEKTAVAFGTTLIGAISDSAGKFRMLAGIYAVSMSQASYMVNEKVIATKESLLSIGDSTGDIRAKSQAVAAAIKSPFESLSTSAYSIMSNVGAGLNRGLADKKGLILSTTRGIANSVVSTLKSVLKIASPSRVMKQIGEQTAQGLAIGLGSSVSEVGQNADALARAITDRNYSSSVGTGGQGDFSALAQRLDQLISLVSGSEQVMQVDGRTFARLIREYS